MEMLLIAINGMIALAGMIFIGSMRLEYIKGPELARIPRKKA